MPRHPAVIGCLLLYAGLVQADDFPRPDVAKLPPAAKQAVDFRRDVQPILTRNCITCHGPARQRSGLRLDDGAAALKGGNSGAVIAPGKAGDSRLLRRGWSLKQLHRLIVTSATYRQSSRARPELEERDPQNILLARQTRHRLEAEVLRDEALAASGVLSRTIGGPSVHPPQPPGISELTYAGSAKWVESTGPDRHRRGLYTWFQRTSPYPMLLTFDAPNANVCVVRRDRSNTPLQALTLLNDAVFVECAQALGRRIVTEVPAPSASEGLTAPRLRHALRLCVGREPTAEEQERLGQLYNDMLRACQAKPDRAAKLIGGAKPLDIEAPEAAAWVALARALLNLDEFVTRE